MEILNSSLSNLVSLLALFTSLAILVRQWRKSKEMRLPPGPWKLPLIGSLHHLVGGLPHRTFRSLAKKYGPLMYLQLGQVPTVVVSSPHYAKQVLKTHDVAFANRPLFTSSDVIFYNNKSISFSQYGEYWRQMRRVCTTELLSAKMVKSYSAIREDELSRLVSSIRTQRGSNSSGLVNVTERIFWFTNSVVCRSAFGKKFKDREEFIRLMKEILILIAGFNVADVFPTWKLLHKMSGSKARLVDAHQKVDAVVEDIINEHIGNRAAGNKGNDEFGGEDLVDVLLRIQEQADQLSFPITKDHIKGIILDIIMAGNETSSTTIIWAFSEMMRNPNIMAKAQSEVRRVFKGKKVYDEEDLRKLTYLNLVIKETFRLHPPAPLMGPRECREQTDIDGYTIPYEARVLVNIWAIGRDPESWHDPESFIPERFENSSIEFMGNNFEYLPFGGGRRVCPGILFASTNVGLSLAQLLHHFEWELPYGTNPKDMDMSETHGITAARQKNLYLIARDHKNDE